MRGAFSASSRQVVKSWSRRAVDWLICEERRASLPAKLSGAAGRKKAPHFHAGLRLGFCRTGVVLSRKVGEGFVGVGHFVDVCAGGHGGAFLAGGSHELFGETLVHGLAALAAGG